MYIYIYRERERYTPIYIYIYIFGEREREREFIIIVIIMHFLVCTCGTIELCPFMPVPMPTLGCGASSSSNVYYEACRTFLGRGLGTNTHGLR